LKVDLDGPFISLSNLGGNRLSGALLPKQHMGRRGGQKPVCWKKDKGHTEEAGLGRV